MYLELQIKLDYPFATIADKRLITQKNNIIALLINMTIIIVVCYNWLMIKNLRGKMKNQKKKKQSALIRAILRKLMMLHR
jgi:hypothetical protein